MKCDEVFAPFLTFLEIVLSVADKKVRQTDMSLSFFLKLKKEIAPFNPSLRRVRHFIADKRNCLAAKLSVCRNTRRTAATDRGTRTLSRH